MGRRQLILNGTDIAGIGSELADAGTDLVNIGSEMVGVGAELANECTENMKEDIVLHNETYAAATFMECLYKKVGTIAAQAADDAQSVFSSATIATTATAVSFAAVVGAGIATVAAMMMLVA